RRTSNDLPLNGTNARSELSRVLPDATAPQRLRQARGDVSIHEQIAEREELLVRVDLDQGRAGRERATEDGGGGVPQHAQEDLRQDASPDTSKRAVRSLGLSEHVVQQRRALVKDAVVSGVDRRRRDWLAAHGSGDALPRWQTVLLATRKVPGHEVAGAIAD